MTKTDQTQDERVDEEAFTAILDALRRRAVWILAGPVVGVVVALLLTLILPPKYTGRATVEFGVLPVAAAAAGLPVSGQQPDEQQANTTTKLAKLGVVRERAAARLGPPYTAEGLKKRVNVKLETQTSLVVISGKAGSAQEAARVTNAVADAFVELRRLSFDAQLATAISRITSDLRKLRASGERGERLKALSTALSTLRLLRATQTGDVAIAERATPPEKKSFPRPIRLSIIGGFIGLLIGLALAIVTEQVDRRLRGRGDVVRASGIPVIAEIPESDALLRRLPIKDMPRDVSDAFQRLRSVISGLTGDERGPRSVLVTSGAARSGKTTVATGLAAAAAHAGERVLLIEADLRRPSLRERLNLPDSGGVADLLETGAAGSAVHVISDNGVLHVLPAGRTLSNPGLGFGSEPVRNLISRQIADYDLVIIDAPPPTLVPDALPLIPMVDAVLVTVRLAEDDASTVTALGEELTRSRAKATGVVLLGSRSSADSDYYG